MQRPSIDQDVLIVGAGPAGLAAGMACLAQGVRPRILEAGLGIDSRDRSASEDVASGVGGAGLFSDGKFSFWPSASALWQLRPTSQLRVAYEWTAQLLSRHGVVAPPFPSELGAPTMTSKEDRFGLKAYPSVRMPLQGRVSLAESLAATLAPTLQAGERAQCASLDRGVVRLDSAATKPASPYHASALILATGRMGPLDVAEILPDVPVRFLRLEVGVRLEQQAARFIVQGNHDLLDPKFVTNEGQVTYRTFCACERGEVIAVDAGGFVSVSGRADISPSPLSSIGFNVRVSEARRGQRLWGELRGRLQGNSGPISEPLSCFLASDGSELRALFGPELATLLANGLRSFISSFPKADVSGAMVHGPCVEGVGEYPRVGRDLKVRERSVWVAGDAVGRFRGLTAALVSGYFAGLRASAFVKGRGQP